jgi:hypothetical protein
MVIKLRSGKAFFVGDKIMATLMPHSLKKLKVSCVYIYVYSRHFRAREYCTLFQWRTAQWDWTLEEPPSQRPVMCAGGRGGLQLVLFQPILWSMAKVLKV